MTLTTEQQKRVEENIGLVHKVLHDKIHTPRQGGIHSYEDLFQIGCIGLCKAAATDRGGTFSTYAYRLIWNEICDALIYATRRQAKETLCEEMPEPCGRRDTQEEDSNLRTDLLQALAGAEAHAPPSTVKGIKAMRLMAQGYSSREVGERMGASDKLVCAWVSKARKYLRTRPELLELGSACRP